jgi:NAD(P)-dependent dehydrogenase (short-subunit alcohol dehydrogenase family)
VITTPFGAHSTAADVIAGIDLSGKRAIVTGASSGIGSETARALGTAGADVTVAVRDTAAGATIAADIAGAVTVAELDLADPRSVAAFVANWDGPLDMLINNAGVMAIPELRLTREGWELQFATNHLGHFALAVGLHDALASAAHGARIVSLSSRGHLRSRVEFDDINFAHRPYDPMIAYGQSKTANVLFAVGATRHWTADGIWTNAVHPGAVDSNLARHIDPAVLEQIKASGQYQFKTAEQGAATSVLVATSPQLEDVGGLYFQDCNEAPVVDAADAESTGNGVATYAVDPTNAERLWNLSLATLL